MCTMSIAFTKEIEGDALEELPDRPLSPHRNLVTPEGLAGIEAEVLRLEGEVSSAQQAEDPDPHQLATLGRDLRYWMARRSSAELVQPIPGNDKVHFGSTVTIEREDGRKQRWRIVGEDEPIAFNVAKAFTIVNSRTSCDIVFEFVRGDRDRS